MRWCSLARASVMSVAIVGFLAVSAGGAGALRVASPVPVRPVGAVADTGSGPVQGGSCHAFSSAYQLPGSHGVVPAAYSDGSLVVPACGPIPGTGGGPAVHPYPGSLPTSGYQCVEFAERYLYYKFGVTLGISTNGDQVVAHYAAKYPSLFTVIPNGTASEVPVQGDVLSFSTSATFSSQSGGHTAVVQSSSVSPAGNGSITVVEENASISGVRVLTVANWRVEYAGFPYIEWLSTPQPWVIQKTQSPGASPILTSISCYGPDACQAVGYATGGAIAEKQSGTTWVSEPVPAPAGSSYVELNGVSCSAENSCEAIGSYANSSGLTLALAERWNGTTWAMQNAPNLGPRTSLNDVLSGIDCVTATDCFAVGYHGTANVNQDVALAERWNGTAWNAVTMPTANGDIGAQAYTIDCSSDTACVAGGAAEQQTGTNGYCFGCEPYQASWNGTSWSIAGTITNPPTSAGDFYLTSISCTGPSDCIAIGNLDNGKPQWNMYAETWNGSQWAGSAIPGNALLEGVSCQAAGTCTAVGTVGEGAGSPAASALWDGTRWTEPPTPSVAGAYNQLSSVSCTARYSCTAVGWTQTATDTKAPLAESN